MKLNDHLHVDCGCLLMVTCRLHTAAPDLLALVECIAAHDVDGPCGEDGEPMCETHEARALLAEIRGKVKESAT